MVLQTADLLRLDYANVRDVEWLRIVLRTAFSKAALRSFGSFATVSTSNDSLEEVIAVIKGEAATPTDENTLSIDDDTGTDEEKEEDADLFARAKEETEDYLLRAWQGAGTAFEHVLAAVLDAIGYTATVTSASKDHGVDVIDQPQAAIRGGGGRRTDISVSQNESRLAHPTLSVQGNGIAKARLLWDVTRGSRNAVEKAGRHRCVQNGAWHGVVRHAGDQ